MRFEIVCPKKEGELEGTPIRLYLGWDEFFQQPAVMADLQDGGSPVELAVLTPSRLHRLSHFSTDAERLKKAGFDLEAETNKIREMI